jgi:outer membrane translocation and assembly module TamA
VARYENATLGADRPRFHVQFESFHEQWNRATLEALESAPSAQMTSSAYRNRLNVEPTVTMTFAKCLTATVGVSFERMEVQTLGTPQYEAANAAVAALRYHRQLEGAGLEQDVEAGYGLRAGTSAMAGDYDYWRHRWTFRYALTYGKHVVTDDVSGGVLVGRAPLFERFVLGNTSTLRGWNKAELDPIGGNRMAHNSVDYRYGALEVFYDAGAIWDSGQPATVRHAVGAGLRQGSFFLALAFPVRSSRMDPVLMMGMNY